MSMRGTYWVEILIAFLLAIAMFLFARAALADEAPPGTVDVIALEEGNPAPFAGLLLSEPAFLRAANARIQVDELTARLGVRDKLVLELSSQLAIARAEHAPESPSVLPWVLGFSAGVAVTLGLVYGAVRVLDATSQ